MVLKECSGSHCETDAWKINNFMSRLEVLIFNMQDEFDFKQHDTEPVYQRMVKPLQHSFQKNWRD